MFKPPTNSVLWCCLYGKIRYESTLVERMVHASISDEADVESMEASQKWNEKIKNTGKENEFRDVFLKPKGKTRSRLSLEKITGRFVPPERVRPDIDSILAVRGPRSKEMSVNQDWPSVWPVAASFRSSVVPLPLRMGYRKDAEKRAPPGSLGNMELLKIPNFLHLTPLAIQHHCEAIKKFCTKWPKELENDLAYEYFPLCVSYSDYIHQGTSLRDNRSRVVSMKFKLGKLMLNAVAREKFIRLVGDRYDEVEDTISITTDRCFTRKQNLEYAMYLIVALYHESLKVEPWEELAQRQDAVEVKFNGSAAESNINEIASRIAGVSEETEAVKRLTNTAVIEKFSKAYEKYRNEKETEQSIEEYGQEQRHLLGISSIKFL